MQSPSIWELPNMLSSILFSSSTRNWDMPQILLGSAAFESRHSCWANKGWSKKLEMQNLKPFLKRIRHYMNSINIIHLRQREKEREQPLLPALLIRKELKPLTLWASGDTKCFVSSLVQLAASTCDEDRNGRVSGPSKSCNARCQSMVFHLQYVHIYTYIYICSNRFDILHRDSLQFEILKRFLLLPLWSASRAWGRKPGSANLAERSYWCGQFLVS